MSLSTSRFFIVICLMLCACQSSRHAVFSGRPELLFAEGKLTEGPAVDASGALYFSDQPNDIIRRMTTEGKVKSVLQPSGVTNGMAFDRQGRLLMCQANGSNYPQDPTAGKRRVVRLEEDSTLTVLADSYHGQPFISPNDLCIDAQGNIYFTDPYYDDGISEKSQPVSGVYRIATTGKVTRVLSDLQKPNGMIITPDNQTMYISDRGTQQLHRYQVKPDGTLTPAGVVFKFPDRGIDGMALDTQGNIYGAAGEGASTGVYVIDPLQNRLLAFQSFPETAYNVCFGGADGNILYVCSGGSIYQMKTKYQGLVLPYNK